MSVSGVAGPNIPRSWTPILDRRDSNVQTASPNSPDQTGNSTDQTGTPTTPFLGKITSEVTDSIMVSLPNGMKVGMFHMGGGSSGFDAQMLASLEHLADNLSAYTTIAKGTDDRTQPDAVGDSSKNTGSSGDLQGTQALDMLHVDLPNGISVEIRHSSASDTDGGVAAMNEMEKAMEELVDHFSNVGGPTDSGSTAANSATSQRALAAYAAQATQKDDAALTDGLGVSRAS